MTPSPISTSFATVSSMVDAVADDRVDEAGVRADHGAGADDGASFEERAGQEANLGLELDGRVDVGVRRIRHGDALAHPAAR